MLKKGICLYYEGKLESNHNCKFKWLALLLVDEDGSNDNVILIMSNKTQKRREVDLLEKSETNFVEMEIFGQKKQ